MCRNMQVLVYVMLLCEFLYCTVFADINIAKDIEAERYYVNVKDVLVSGGNKEDLNKLILNAGFIRPGFIPDELYYTYYLLHNMNNHEKLELMQHDKNSVISSFKSNDVTSTHLNNVGASDNGHSIRKRDYFDRFHHENYYNQPHHTGPPQYEMFRPPPNRIHERPPPPFQGGFYSNENNFYPSNDRFPPHEFSAAYKGDEFHSRPTRDGSPGRPYYGGPPYNGGPYPPPIDGAWDRPRGGPYEGPPIHAGPPPPYGGPPPPRPGHPPPPPGPPPPHAGPPPPYDRPPMHRGPPPQTGPPQYRGPPNERPQYEGPKQEEQSYETPPSQGEPQYEILQPQEEPSEKIASYETFAPPNKNINSANDGNQENVNTATTAQTHAMYINNENKPTKITSMSDSQTTTRPLYLIQAQAVTPEE